MISWWAAKQSLCLAMVGVWERRRQGDREDKLKRKVSATMMVSVYSLD
jgi:hypothetical protein